MTLGVEEATPSAADRRHSSRGWVIAGAVALVVMLLVIGLVVWKQVANAYRGDLTISMTHPPTCSGATVRRRVLSNEAPRRFDVISAQPGMSCTITVRFANNSPVTLHLGTATWPYLGRGNESLLQLTGPSVVSPVDGRLVGGAPSYAIHASEDLDRDLAAGAAYEQTYHLIFNSNACNDGTTYVLDMPEVQATALGSTGVVHGSVRVAASGVHKKGCHQ